jgi:hypothetical protein
MSIWIRSQDKKQLTDVAGKRLFVWYTPKMWHIYVDPMTSDEDVSISLGEYTEDRAIDVLGDIQDYIIFCDMSKCVFQMPER